MLWLVPPVVHQYLHYCPIRPDGLNQADAVPAYARKYQMSCTQCHTAWPLLNAYGRQFKLNGYVRTPGGAEGVETSQDGSLAFEKMLPWAAIVRSRLYDKTSNDSNFKMQGVSDLDMFIAGGDASRHVSAFLELDANANSSPSFAANTGDLQLGYHPIPYANFLVARRGFFVMDPYQDLSNFGSPTVGNRAIAGLNADQGNLSGNTMDETTQTAAMYGFAGLADMAQMYYQLGITAANGNDPGNGPKSANARLALTNKAGNLEIGTFGTSGYAGSDAPNNATGDKIQYSRTGVDTMAEVAGFAARAAFMFGYDKDLNTWNAQSERAAYAELLYVFHRADSDTPFLVPLLRENWYTTINGTSQFNYLTAQLAHYFQPNVKAFIEYNAVTKSDVSSASAPDTAPKSNEWSAQVEVGF